MILDIHLRDGKVVQVPSFKEAKISIHELEIIPAEQISDIRLVKSANYAFIGANTVTISGEDILYLESN
ncbi:hypothetical protein IGJ55_002123 [Enterococcus sp. AZ170]|uniref:hypothetical protein n=1 Tax=Enterococcus sp. AZ170 TaxID=2774747 RepID=UPI003D2FD1FE